MRKIREILRLHHESKLSANRIAQSVHAGRAVVQECLRRARNAELIWPLPAGLDDAQLDSMLYPPQRFNGAKTSPCFEEIHRELRSPGVTLERLWHEYQEVAGNPYSYSQFTVQYRRWKKQINLVMRQEHRAGEKMFVDWSGKTARIIDPETGEVKQAQIFVAVLGASYAGFAIM